MGNLFDNVFGFFTFAWFKGHRTELIALGCEPFPMVYDRGRPELLAFARWAICHLYRKIAFPDYGAAGNGDTRLTIESRASAKAAWERVAAGWKPPRRLAVEGAA